jgi:hypothetical protein
MMSIIEDAFKLQRSIEKGEPQMSHPVEPNVADAKQRALDLYKPPFRIDDCEDGDGAYTSDSNLKFVCQVFSNTDGELIAEALNEYYANHKEK